MSTDYYVGEVASALARCRRVLKRAGIPLYTISGRYRPLGPAQKQTPGVKVSRVGLGRNIALHAWLGSAAPIEKVKDLESRAIAVLREAGLPFDGRGWLETRVVCWRCGAMHESRRAERACRRARAQTEAE